MKYEGHCVFLGSIIATGFLVGSSFAGECYGAVGIDLGRTSPDVADLAAALQEAESAHAEKLCRELAANDAIESVSVLGRAIEIHVKEGYGVHERSLGQDLCEGRIGTWIVWIWSGSGPVFEYRCPRE